MLRKLQQGHRSRRRRHAADIIGAAVIRGVPCQPRRASRGVARGRRGRRGGGRGRRGRRTGAPRGPRQDAAARTGGGAARSRQPVSGSGGHRGARALRGRGTLRRGDRRGGPRAGARLHGGVQRRHREGRHLLPDDRQEAPARAGDRRGMPSALHLSRGQRRREPAQSGRGVPRPRPFRADLLQSGADERERHRADRRGDGKLHRRRRLCARDERCDDHRPRSGHDLSGRAAAGEGRDRRGGHRRGSGRRRCAHAAVGRGRLPRRGRRACAGTRAARGRQSGSGAEP